ncbi:MAG: Maf family protein [Anaerolineales bacterium]|nr:Maf family protein [Anaerolineales bacterium]
MSEKPLLVLASNSPRRRELLALTGWPFSVMPADVGEDLRPAETPRGYVLRLAQSKARACAKHAGEAAFILAADTTVVNGKDTLGKPKNTAEAIEMLTALRGHSHQVYTGIALLRLKDGRLLTDVCVTDVPMREYSHEEIVAYVATRDPLDKAGAYAIQHPKFQPVEKLSGCYASVMGLPLCHLVRCLQEFEVAPAVDVPGNCQSMLNYTCHIFPRIIEPGGGSK